MPHSRSTPVVLLVDSRDLRRASLVSLLGEWAKSAEVAIVAVEPSDVITAMGDHECRMVVLNMGAGSVGEREIDQTIKVIRALGPSVPVVVVSDREEVAEMRAALNTGAQGFIPSSMNPRLALQAISFILAGGSYFPPSAIREAAQPSKISSGPSDPDPGVRSDKSSGRVEQDNGDDHFEGSRALVLTPRQSEVLRLLKEGQSNKLIGRNLGMTEATVKVHMRQIMRKLGAQNRTQAALCEPATHENDSDECWDDEADTADRGIAIASYRRHDYVIGK